MNNAKTVCLIFFLILISGNIYFGVKYFFTQKELSQTKNALEAIRDNKKYLDFNQIFIDKVLKSSGSVSLESRLEMEIAARDLKDAEVLTQWKKFIDSSSEKDSQEAVKDLLGMLAEKSAF